MRHIDRLPEPDILREKGSLWLTKYIESGKKRPDSSKYAHPSIKQALESMSHTKCFYCECSVKEGGEEVDHHIEVTVDKNQAFNWENLYLSCSDCNKKVAHNVIKVEDALDPIVDSDDEIRRHINFAEESIYEVNGSVKGQNTIKKYRLNSKVLDNRRRKQLQKLLKTIVECLKKGGINALTDADKEAIRRYAYKSSPFSYMCECYLRDKFSVVFEKKKLCNQ